MVFFVVGVVWNSLRDLADVDAVAEVGVVVRRGKADIRLRAMAGTAVPETEVAEKVEERLRSRGRREEVGSERQSACVSVIPAVAFLLKSRSYYERVVKGCEWNLRWYDKEGREREREQWRLATREGCRKKTKGSKCKRFVYEALTTVEGQSRKVVLGKRCE